MSQYPPPPPSGQPPFGQQPIGQPPMGQPPMGQPPLGQAPMQNPYGQPYRAPGTSGAAIGSLICGILGCIPFVTSLLAIILGIVGIKSTGPGRAGGRGLAIAGLILGLLGIIGWTSFGALGLWGWTKGKQLAASTATPFVQAVSSGDYTTASKYTTMTPEEMTALHDQIASWGTVSGMSVNGINAQKNAGTPGRITMTGHATFSTAGSKDFDVEMDSRQGGFKVVNMEFK